MQYKVGAPPMYNSPAEMQDKIEEYFEKGFRTKRIIEKINKSDVKVYEVPVITIADLSIFLGFASRQSFYDYEQKEEFSYTIKRARLFIEAEYEALLRDNPTAAIFALKNFGWTDKQEHEMYGKDGVPLNSGVSELKEIAEGIKKLIPDNDESTAGT